MLGVLFMVLLITLALAIAAPKVAASISRDKEIETVHRGMQYARAIQIYYNKFGRYPNTIDQLVKEQANQVRKGWLKGGLLKSFPDTKPGVLPYVPTGWVVG